MWSRFELTHHHRPFHSHASPSRQVLLLALFCQEKHVQREATPGRQLEAKILGLQPWARASSTGMSWFTLSSWFIPSACETRRLLSSGSRRDPLRAPRSPGTGRVCNVHRRGDGLIPRAPGPVVTCRLLGMEPLVEG